MHRVQVQLTDEQLAVLQERSGTTARSVAALVRDAVDTWIARDERQRRGARAIGAIGGFHSGLGDLATDHDRYFVEDVER